MTLIDDSFWTLRIDPMRPTPLTPEEPEDFIHEMSGKILCAGEDDKDRIAGRFRIYYADVVPCVLKTYVGSIIK